MRQKLFVEKWGTRYAKERTWVVMAVGMWREDPRCCPSLHLLTQEKLHHHATAAACEQRGEKAASDKRTSLPTSTAPPPLHTHADNTGLFHGFRMPSTLHAQPSKHPE